MLRQIKFLFALSLSMVSFSIYAASVNTLFRHAGDPVAGNPRGGVTVVEFFDYQCGHCVAMAPTMNAIISANPNVRVVYKEFPIRGAVSDFAARAALAANKQGKYRAFSHALLTTSQPLNPDYILDVAKSVGLNVEKLKKDMRSSSVTNDIRTTYKLADEYNINGTPAFIIGKTNAQSSNDVNMVLGEMSQSELQDAINKASS